MDWFNDSTPTIHVGFAHTEATWNVAMADAQETVADRPNIRAITACWKQERQIVFPNTTIRFSSDTATEEQTPQPWSFGVPPASASSYATAPYYRAGVADNTAVIANDPGTDLKAHSELKPYVDDGDYSRLWFRNSFLHELLHAFGHQDHVMDYSFLTNSSGDGRPWANTSSADDRIRPLPYDIGWLRSNYPAGGTYYDVSVLNTWYAPQDAHPDQSTHVALCWPSLGSDLSDDVGGAAGNVCGVNGSSPGSRSVCPGQTLQTRFAVTNGSTESVDLTFQLALSSDEVWDGGDYVSKSVHSLDNLGAAHSKLMGPSWVVPNYDLGRGGAPWYVLVKVYGDHVSAYTIPLRAAVYMPAGGC
jgi:hypothetical protein